MIHDQKTIWNDYSYSERPNVPSARLSAEPSVVHSAEAEPSVMPTEGGLRSSKKAQKMLNIRGLFDPPVNIRDWKLGPQKKSKKSDVP